MAVSLLPPAVYAQEQDSLPRTKKSGSGLDDIISSQNQDSMVYNVRGRTVYIYGGGDVTYQNINLTGEYMRVDMDMKEIFAEERTDTLDGKPSTIRPSFTEGNANPYSFEHITYNMDTKKAKIAGVATQEGDGWLIGGEVKKMRDNTSYIYDGKYTTCDQTEAPHFYLEMTRAKMIPGKKVVTGPAYLVLEDVPIYFLLLPEGFFPISQGPKSGILFPTFGEEQKRGFFMRGLGYYFAISQHMDLAVRGGIYTLGSWEAELTSRYTKRYKHQGNLKFLYSDLRMGDSFASDYRRDNSFQFIWQHTQDPKANPGSTFSASVDFRTANFNSTTATSLDEALQTSTSSTISYSKSWLGTPFSLSANMSIGQNSQSGELRLNLPNMVFNVATIYPFKRKEMMGNQRWYEKINIRYTGKFNNSVEAKESDILTKQTLKNMNFGFEHTIPIAATYNLFKYINFGPTGSYTEKWLFKRQQQVWNPDGGTPNAEGTAPGAIETLEPKYGFYRLYNYNVALQASTIIYGRFENKNKEGKVQAVRHTISPSISVSYAPRFNYEKSFDYIKGANDTIPTTHTYDPYRGAIFGAPNSGEAFSINGSLSQTVEMKVLSKRDTSGVRKIKIIDELRIGGVSWNFVAKERQLSTIPLSIRTTLFQNFGVTVNATLDPYRLTPEGGQTNKLFFPGRIQNASTSLGYSFNSREDTSIPAVNDLSTGPAANPFYFDPRNPMDPAERRRLMAQTYYDFSLPWNVSFSYSVSYSVMPTNNGTTGYRPQVTQSVNVNGSLNVLPKMGLTFQGGYDFSSGQLTPAQVTIHRDLHCWEMSFAWIPFGQQKSWSFNIQVKAASLKDLKYDKSQSRFENTEMAM